MRIKKRENYFFLVNLRQRRHQCDYIATMTLLEMVTPETPVILDISSFSSIISLVQCHKNVWNKLQFFHRQAFPALTIVLQVKQEAAKTKHLSYAPL
jgi:hypothetical protein